MAEEEKEEGRAIEGAIAADDWARAEALLAKVLERRPESHWCWARLALVCHEQRQYGKALEHSQRALGLAPRCPLALWEKAGALDALGREREAIAVWKGLLSRGVRDIAYGRCGEGKRWAESLLNDCRYRIAFALFELGDSRMAARFIRGHLLRRKRGLSSCYSRREALGLEKRIGGAVAG